MHIKKKKKHNDTFRALVRRNAKKNAQSLPRRLNQILKTQKKVFIMRKNFKLNIDNCQTSLKEYLNCKFASKKDIGYLDYFEALN